MKMSPTTGGILLCQHVLYIIRNRVGKWKHPQGFALMGLTARSADIFYIFVKP